MPKKPTLRRYVLGAAPKAEESFIGFIFRLSERIGLFSGNRLFFEAGAMQPTNRPNQACLENLAELGDLGVDELRAITYGMPSQDRFAIYRGHRILSVWLTGYASRKVCPKCLEEAAFYQSCWDLTIVSACPAHGVHLCTKCQYCGRHLNWAGAVVLQCECRGGDFRRMACNAVSAEVADAAASVLGLLGDARYERNAESLKTLAPFRDLDQSEIIEFAARMGLTSLAGWRRPFGLEGARDVSSAASETLAGGIAVAGDWPNRFYEALSKKEPLDSYAVEIHPVSRLIEAIRRWVAGMPDGHGTVIANAVGEYEAGCTSEVIRPPFVDLRDWVKKARMSHRPVV